MAVQVRNPARSMAVFVVAVLLAACTGSAPSPTPSESSAPARGVHLIKHVIVIMQENRSFDSYFGTFPGADGLTLHDGTHSGCIPSLRAGHCVRPYHDPHLVNAGGPHTRSDVLADIDHGKMDGFVIRAERGARGGVAKAVPICRRRGPVDVMGYHDSREIPNYWTWAKHFTLQDHLFAAGIGWSLVQHLRLVSGWSA